jgi:hypothetical protein
MPIGCIQDHKAGYVHEEVLLISSIFCKIRRFWFLFDL